MVKIVKNKSGYDVLSDGEKVGEIKYTPFWDGAPYITKFVIDEKFRRRGIGSCADGLFAEEMRKEGNKAVLVSTQSDENGQKFYRKNGYSECGCLILENTPFKQAMELFFIKIL